MSYAERQIIQPTTDANGAATAYSSVVTGKVSQVVYLKDGTTPYDNGVGFTITAEATSEAVLTLANANASAAYAPRLALHNANGAAALYAAGGTPILEPIAVAKDRIKIVVAAGGNAKTGTFHVILV